VIAFIGAKDFILRMIFSENRVSLCGITRYVIDMTKELGSISL